MAEPTPVVLPSDHPASIQCSAWLDAFNIGDRETLATYHNDLTFPYSVASWDIGDLNREHSLAQASGGFDVVELEDRSLPASAVILLREKHRPQYARVAISVDLPKANFPVTKFEIHPITTPIKYIPEGDPRRKKYEKALQPLTSELRKNIVDGINTVLLNQYVNPELGQKIVDALNSHRETGNYDSFEESNPFARRLTDDLRNTGNDQHMRVAFIEPPPHRKDEDEDKDKDRKRPNHMDHLRRINFGFGNISFDVDSSPHRTIATLPINGFVHSSEKFAADWKDIRAAISEKVSTVADADALLIDLRENHGGDPSTVAFIQSYLLDGAPQHLIDFVDSVGKIHDSFSTTPPEDLPAGSKRFGATKPLYILTSKDTISGGEDMAYNLRAFKRAKAIVGEGNEATVGAANPITKPRFICEEEFGKGRWLVAVPNLKPIHEVTGTNWEGIGVKSDVIAGSGEWEGVDAKEVGTKMAVKALQE